MKFREIGEVLRHYGADVNPVSGRVWRNMKCPFHEDNSASAQYDQYGFRCFTCDAFFPGPIQLIMWKEGWDYDRARDFYEQQFGSGHRDLPGNAGRDGGYLPGFSRHDARRSEGVSTRRRPGGPAGA